MGILKNKKDRWSWTKIGGALLGLGTVAAGLPEAFPVAATWAPVAAMALKGLGTMVGTVGLRNALEEKGK